MIFSMITIVHAEGTLTINYWNADSTKITLGLSEEIDPAVLEAGIELTGDDADVEFTVKKREKTVDETVTDYSEGKYEVSGMRNATDITYEIIPENGLDFGVIYSITVSGDVTGAEAWNKVFKVKKLWIENFDNYIIADNATKGTSTNLPWQIEGGGNEPEIGLMDDGTGDKAMYWSHKGSIYRVSPSYAENAVNSDIEFADTGVAASTYWASNSSARKETEYNVELDLRFNTVFSDPKYGYGFKIAMQNLKHTQVIYGGSGIVAGLAGSGSNFSMLAGTWGHGTYTYNSIGSFSTNSKNALKSNWYEYFSNGAPYTTDLTWNNNLIKKSSLDDGNWENDTVHKISMSVKENNLKFSADDGFVNYDFDEHEGKTNKEFGLFSFFGSGNYGGANTYCVDNIVVTKAIEISTYSLDDPTDVRISRENIKFDLAADIDADSIRDYVKLEKNGEEIFDFNVSKTEGSSYTYAITPDEGIDVDGKYKVTLFANTFEDSDGNYAVLGSDFSKEISIVLVPMSAPLAWNADSTKITLDFETRLDANDLANALTVECLGEEVSFTVTEKTQTSPSKGVLKDGNPTYVIVPDDGIMLDTLYKLRINAGLINYDYTQKLAEDYSLSFVVEKLWKDDFESYDAANFRAYSIYTLSASGYGTEDKDENWGTVSNYVTLYDNGSDKSLRITGGRPVLPNFSYAGKGFNFADTNKPVGQYPYALEKDYTVEFKLDFESDVHSTSTVTDVRFLMKDNAHANPSYSQGIVTGIGNNKGKYFDLAFLNCKVDGSSHQEASTESTGAYDSSNYRNTISFSPFAEDGLENTVTMSVKDMNIKFFFNDSVFNSYNCNNLPAAYGYPSFYANSGTVALIDDIVVTKAKEYVESSYTMTPDNGENDVAIGDTIKLTFENAVDSATLSSDTVKVYKDGKQVYDYSVTLDNADAKNVIVKFNAPFEYRTEYRVAPLGVGYVEDATSYAFPAYSFTTTVPDFEITSFDAGDVDMNSLIAGSYDVKAEFANNKIEKGISFVASICLYNEEGKMVDIVVKEFDLAKGKADSISDTWNIADEGKYFAKCYLWDDFVNMNSLLTAVID